MTHRATPSAPPPPDALRPVAPLWAFGLEGGWLSRHLAAGLAAAAGDAPRLAGIRDALAAWNVERQPLYPAFAAAALAAGRRLGDPPAR
ncbi:MAG: glycosyltransferase family 2 protein, partial [Solidesulfovibrio sp.]|nr:glycosyltransferase family 2 protein [Solidesulfovibrio sp.]